MTNEEDIKILVGHMVAVFVIAVFDQAAFDILKIGVQLRVIFLIKKGTVNLKFEHSRFIVFIVVRNAEGFTGVA